jgi:hypothetical protein
MSDETYSPTLEALKALEAKLFADVVAYGSRSSHRTGTVDDEATIEWFQSILRADGAKIQVDTWSFPQWTATWTAELDGEQIDSLPLFYETTGNFGAAAIDFVATEHPGGLLTVKNRHALPSTVAADRATMFVPGRLADRVKDIRAQIIGARINLGNSANVLASYGCEFSDAQVLIATPLSGWFQCASERGTGIAVARYVARTLAEHGYRVAFLGTSGHELFNIGLEHYLANNVVEAPVIVHVGASVGARSPYSAFDEMQDEVVLSDSVYVRSNQADRGAALAACGFHHRTVTNDPKLWIGEGTRWCTQNRPLLSVAGMSHWFHTPQDTAEVSTHPALLARVAQALLEDTIQMLEANSQQIA